MSSLRERIDRLLKEKKDHDDVMDIILTDFIESREYDDTLDAVFKHLAPRLVRHVLEREINEDVAEFTDGAIEGRWEKQRGWAGEDPSPKESGYPEDSLDYKMGYSWGWANADVWEGDTLPADARKAAVEMQIEEFEGEISEEMVIAALETANKKINPWELLKQAGRAVSGAYEEAGGGPEGVKAAIKKGIPVALSILIGEALDNFIIPMAFFSLTGIPIPPLPVGVGEIINPIVISMVGAEEAQEELENEFGWYEKEYGPITSFGQVVDEGLLRRYINEVMEIKPKIQPNSQIFCDMDGVLVHFEEAVVGLVNNILDTGEIPGVPSTKGHRKRLYWLQNELGEDWRATKRSDLDLKPVRNLMFSAIGQNPGPIFASMPPWPDALNLLWPYITSTGHTVNILSAPIRAREGAPSTTEEGKIAWIEKWLRPAPSDIIITPAVSKVEYATAGGVPNILIDDKASTVDAWNGAGGIGILHIPGGSSTTVNMLEGMGL